MTLGVPVSAAIRMSPPLETRALSPNVTVLALSSTGLATTEMVVIAPPVSPSTTDLTVMPVGAEAFGSAPAEIVILSSATTTAEEPKPIGCETVTSVVALKSTSATAPPDTPTTVFDADTFVAVPTSRSPRVESVTFAPTSTAVVTFAVVLETSELNENAPPLEVPTRSSIVSIDCGRIVIPPGASRSTPETIFAPSPITTREPESTVIVVPPRSGTPARDTTPPPLTLAEAPSVVRVIEWLDESTTIPVAETFAPPATTARASAWLASNEVTGMPPTSPPPKDDDATVEYPWERSAVTSSDPTASGVEPSAEPTLPIVAFVFVRSTSRASTVATPTIAPFPFEAATTETSSWLAFTKSRSTLLLGAATAPSPSVASTVVVDVAEAKLLPMPTSPPEPPP